jgi:hypothetical protein
MIKNLLRAFAFSIAFQAAVHAQTTGAAEMGRFERVTGRVSVAAPGSEARVPDRGSVVFSGEVVTTEDDSEAVITATDGARMTLRAKSRLEMTDYSHDRSNNSGSFITSLIRGSVRMISGLIGKTQPRNHQVVTPTATVGIRGTDFEVVVTETDTDDIRAGTYDHVFDGATTLTIASGETLDVPQDKTGLALANPREGEARLQLLDSRPAFIRGGGFDAMQLLRTRPMIIRR